MTDQQQRCGRKQRFPAASTCIIVLLTALLLSVAAVPDKDVASYCPDVVGGVCQRACQLYLCEALAQFYKVSNNVTDPWDQEQGWELTSTASCTQLMASAAGGKAVYCDWYGVTCCTPPMIADGNCSAVNGVAALELPINNMNVSLSNPKFLESIQKLHGCGLTVLNLEANNLINGLTEEWGTLVNLKVLSMGNCWVSGTIPVALRHLRNLTHINFSNNWLNGTLPHWLDELQHLQILNLGSEYGENAGTDGQLGLLGTIPRELSHLLHLRELNLEANSLTGTVPQLCLKGDGSEMLLLSLRANHLSGNPDAVAGCGNLVLLDISDNQFTGTLPVSKEWDELASYRASRNQLTGTIPLQLCRHARILQLLDVSDNHLTGDVPNQIALLGNIKTFNLAGNNFTGTISEDLFYLASLTHLDLSRNGFVGTIPGAIGLAFSLQDVDFSSNPGITGLIPPEVGLLGDLSYVLIEDTAMSCSGLIKPFSVSTNNSCTDPRRCTTPRWYGSNTTRVHHCSDDELLPCFLRFSDYQIPRDDASNMRCRYIVRKDQHRAIDDCSGSSPQSLGDQTSLLPDAIADGTQQTWTIDPSYYQFRECSCLVGYSEVWENDGTKLVCVDQPLADTRITIVIAIVSALAGVVLLIALGLVWLLYLRTRPRWLRERVMQSKRTRGAPRCTKQGEKITVSIVVTDVKDFSDLTRQYPELMNKAMGGHNNILRKACNAHAGYVLDQEGDSWSIAFHDAEDACSFALQVQQALAHKVWGMRLPNADHTLDLLRNVSSLRHEGFSTKGNMMTSTTSAGAPDSVCEGPLDPASVQQQILQASEPSFRAARAGPSFTSSTGHLCSSASSASGLDVQHSVHSGTAPSATGSIGRLFGRHGSRSSKGSEPKSVPLAQLSFTDANALRDSSITQGHQRPSGLESNSSWAAPPSISAAAMVSKSSFGSSMAPERAVGSMVGSFAGKQSSGGDGGSTSNRTWGATAIMRRFSNMTGRNSAVSSQVQVAGDSHYPLKVLRLAVRIGIATGPLAYGVDVSNCAVKDCAKEIVSDVANGGQVLMDEATFRLVKDSLSMLGTVTENGCDDDALQHLLHARVMGKLQHQVICGGCRSMSRDLSFTGGLFDREPQDYDNDALVVHMGCFDVPNAPMDDPTKQNSSGSDSDKDQLELVIPGSRGRNRSSHKLVRQKVHLYSIAAPGMRRRPENTQELTRLLCWAENVNLKPGWVQTQKGYFDSPGARQMDLTPSSQLFGHSQAPLPDVTIIFVSVANASTFTSKRPRSETHHVNKAIIKCLLQQMRGVPGGDGYLCRCQEADLKYMVAFEQPHKAVQWCLLVQEAMMYVDWPDSVLNHPGFEEVLNPATGLPLFRGPRLRMGLAEGQPNSVLPDHEGRANYYGGSINRAARFMDAAAHGGQVVTSLDLVRKLFMDWVAQDRERQGLTSFGSLTTPTAKDAPTAGADAAGGSSDTAAQWHLQRQPSSPRTLEPRSPATQQIQGQLLPRWGRTRQQQHLSSEQLHGSSMLQLAHRSRSETAARFDHSSHWSRHGLHLPLTRHNEEGCSSSAAAASTAAAGMSLPPRSRSYTSATRLIRADHDGAGHGDGSPFAAVLQGPLPSGLDLPQIAAVKVWDPVIALHLGNFAFKGSGEYEMVQILHAALASRLFPAEAPKGKGERVSMQATGTVKDLPEVRLQVPTALVAARQAFSAVNYDAAAY